MSVPSTSGRDEERANGHALATVTARFTLHLHPSKTQDVMAGVREQLNMGLLRHSEDLGGVVLAYSDMRVAGGSARLHPYFPFLAVTATARATVFRPRKGQHLVGRVIKVGADYVGLLVLGVFNAAIGAQRIRREFKCSPESNSWVSMRDPTHRIKVGGYVRFAVDSALDSASLFSISGSLLDPGTGEWGHCAAAEGKQRANGVKEGAQQQRQDGGKEGKDGDVAVGQQMQEKQKKRKEKWKQQQEQDGQQQRQGGQYERKGKPQPGGCEEGGKRKKKSRKSGAADAGNGTPAKAKRPKKG